MNIPHISLARAPYPFAPRHAWRRWIPVCACCLLLAACGRDQAAPQKSGQALASVNGEEITVLQLNEEMQRAGVPAARQQTASKQLLQVLIDRALLEEAAAAEKLDRDPKVMQAIERARALIIAQAYMQKRVGDAGQPSQAEIREYFDQHPQFFANRRQFTMNQLIMPAATLTPELRAAADKAVSLEEVAVMLDARKIGYGRAQVTRSTADLNPQLAARLLSMPKGQIFFVKEGERAMLVSVADVVDAPVTLAIAAPQVAQYLTHRKHRELAQAEIARLRSTASIAYLNKELAPEQGQAKAKANERAAGAVLARAQAGTAPGVREAGTSGNAAQAGKDDATGAGAPPGRAVPTGSQAGAQNGTQNGAAGADADKAALERGVAGLK